MGEHAGEFTLGVGIQEQPAVDADDAPRRGKGVEFLAVDEDEFEASILQLAGLGQAVHGGFDEILELRIGQLADLAAQQAQPGAAQIVFLLRGDDGRTGIAQRRQIVSVGGHCQQAGQRDHQGAQ